MSERPMYRNALRSKKAIKGALVSLLSEKDIAKIKIKEIIDLADISKGTFYAHYSDIYDILSEIEDDNIKYLLDFLKSEASNEMFDDFLPFIRAMFKRMEEEHAFFEKIFLSPYFDHMFIKVQTAIITYAMKHNKKFTKITLTKDSKMFLTYTLSGAIQVIRDWYKGEYSISLDDLAVKINNFMMNGIKSIFVDENI